MAKEAVGYLPGEDPGDVQANQEYQTALQKMLSSLDARQNRMFDPTLLALAEGFLKPTQTGSFGESLGYAASGMRQAQEKEVEQEQKLAQARLELSQQGLALQRQKARERMFRQAIGGEGAPEGAEPAAGPSGPPVGPSGPVSAAGVAQGVAQADAGRLAEPEGIQFMPPDRSMPTYRQFMTMMAQDPSVSPAEAQRRWQELQQKQREVRESGVVNLATGRFYPSKPDQVEVQIYGSTYKVPPGIAAALNAAQQRGDMAAYKQIADRYLQRGEGATPEGAPVSVAEAEIRRAADLKREETLATEAAKREAEVEQRNLAAQRIFANTQRLQEYVKKNSEAFGIFARPGVLPALGKAISEGLRVGSTQVALGDFEGVIRGMTGMTQQKLDAVMLAAGDLAEIELTYTQLYMKNQGQITEGEREIVRRIPGGVSQSPTVLLQKAKLLETRAQHDMNVADLFYRMKDEKPSLTYLQFERSPQYRQMTKQYNEHLSKLFGGQAAVPRTPAAEQSAPPAAATPQPQAPPARTATPSAGAGSAPLVRIPRASPADQPASRFPGAVQRLDSIMGR
jgi:hypothetical protein